MPAPKFPVPADAVCRPEDYTIVNGYLKKYSGNAPIIRIPDGVQIIGRNAFSRKEAIKEVYLPDGIQNIETFAFKLCTALMKISLPDSVTSIGIEAFNNCSSLSNITIPGNCVVESNAFPEGCTVIRR